MKKLKFFIIGVLCLLNIFTVVFFIETSNKEEFKITFLDVGQGNSVMIERNNKKILIDTGYGMDALKKIYDKSGFFSRSFDAVFLSHYDLDHVGLFPFLIQNFNMHYLFETSAYNNCAIRDEIVTQSLIKKYDLQSLSAGDIIWLDAKTKIEVLFPDAFFKPDVLDDNEGSLVLKVFYESKTFLIMGDLPKKFEKFLIKKYGTKLKSDVLMAGHHGSKTSSSLEFLEIVDPEYIVISVGGDNQYGMPHKVVLENAQKLDIEILRTDMVGDIVFYFNNNIFYKGF